MTESFRYLTLASTLASEVSYSFIPESPTSGDWVEELCQAVRKARFSTSWNPQIITLLTHVRNDSRIYRNMEIFKR